MAQPIITTKQEFSALCDRLAGTKRIVLDTEFVSEHSYRPELCLLQVGLGDELVVVDALAVGDVTPLWQVLATEGRETVVHAGRQELLFCYDAIGRGPSRLFDVQLAAGMTGLDFPAGYGALISRLLKVHPQKGETRTDWRKRPLSDRQIEYALADIRYLRPLHDVLAARLEKLNRRSWFDAEMIAWQKEVENSRNDQRWRKVSGSSGLPDRSQAIVRQLWLWREKVAAQRNRPVRQILRDDLIVELARCRSSDPKRIGAVRGMERRDLRQALPELSRAIAQGLALPEEQCPQTVRAESAPQLTMLVQFLASALNSICRAAKVAPSMVGTIADIKELVAHRLGDEADKDDQIPALTQGWRAEVVGQLLDDLLRGKVSIRISDPHAEQPLAFERFKSR